VWLVAWAISAPANTAQAPPPTPAAPVTRAGAPSSKPANLRILCLAIDGHGKDPSNKYDYYYQRIIMEAAGVGDDGTESVANMKIRNMCNAYEDGLICNNIRFNVQDGSVLKFAISAKLEDFIFDAALFLESNPKQD
jgi:glycerophosphoryl diester phosphodiesterase